VSAAALTETAGGAGPSRLWPPTSVDGRL